MVEYAEELSNALHRLDHSAIGELTAHLKRQRAESNQVFVCGNGGSHAVAAHWGADLAKHGELNIVTLGGNVSLLTAWSNDIDYATAFSRELLLRSQGRRDSVVCLSCSGQSPNILAVIAQAFTLSLPLYLITSYMAPEPRYGKVIPIHSSDYGVLEDTFAAIGHGLVRELSWAK